MNESLFDQVRQLSVEEQIELVEALWDNIVERNAVPGPTDAQKAELDRRLLEHATVESAHHAYHRSRPILLKSSLRVFGGKIVAL
jgi:putative addiction module component (TIGR02574 family)